MSKHPLAGADFTCADISGLSINGQKATWQMLAGFGAKVSGIDLACEKAAEQGRAFGLGSAPELGDSPRTFSMRDISAALNATGIGGSMTEADRGSLGNLAAPTAPDVAERTQEAGITFNA